MLLMMGGLLEYAMVFACQRIGVILRQEVETVSMSGAEDKYKLVTSL